MLHHAGVGPRTPARPRRARALVAAGVCTAALAVACGPRSQAAAPPTGGGLSVSYEAPSRGGEDERAFLRGRRLPEQVAADLNRTVRLPQPVRIVGRSCEKDGIPEYDPESGRISLCYGFIGEVRSMFAAERDGGDPDERTAGVVTETLYHEAGHALIDKLALPFTGHEEDVADQFAAYRLLSRGETGRAALLAAADNYAQYAREADPSDVDPSDEHAPDAMRSASYRCYLYGSAPRQKRGKEYRSLVDGKRLSKERAGLCEEEYESLRRGWQRLLAPHMSDR
ncbi:DUF4344 domain-containing metallopeptidase [Streptomyces sp. SCA3-4]|uniref:DUF4344 domain-containing metallopeptidase n=1 Tax=Streptomyces sichuanensis TaxID=2871810 RepID=UPI001CE30C55|nr:DUF4344 domain-containing metallopeptidase [Streptomyces sichuanensis]MCA6092445.1 DUF4344 domain-containing metallopeptidase [Streptomyces sichuanensis]